MVKLLTQPARTENKVDKGVPAVMIWSEPGALGPARSVIRGQGLPNFSERAGQDCTGHALQFETVRGDVAGLISKAIGQFL